MMSGRWAIMSGAVIGAAGLVLAAVAGGCATDGPAAASDERDRIAGAGPAGVVTAAQQSALTPDDVLEDLMAGNRRFVSRGGVSDRDLPGQIRATATGQHPKAVVLSCLDSRVVPELLFDQGVGDLFVGRVAGNFVNTDMLGSMEFATQLAGSKLIVVMGHTSCGAVKGAADNAELGNLTATLANIRPAVQEVQRRGVVGPQNSGNDAYVQAIAEANVRRTVDEIERRSPVMSGLIERGELKVVGGMYDISTGRVSWFEG